jgi:transposase
MDGLAMLYGTSRKVAAVEIGGMSCNRAAKQFGVGISTAINWVKRLLDRQRSAGQDGRAQAKEDCGRAPPLAVAADQAGDFTLRGLVAELAERGLKVDYRSVWEFVNAKKLSFKKRLVAGERDRPDVARRRAQRAKYQNRIEPERLVFIDETWTRPKWPRCTGGRRAASAWSPRFCTDAGRPQPLWPR